MYGSVFMKYLGAPSPRTLSALLGARHCDLTRTVTCSALLEPLPFWGSSLSFPKERNQVTQSPVVPSNTNIHKWAVCFMHGLLNLSDAQLRNCAKNIRSAISTFSFLNRSWVVRQERELSAANGRPRWQHTSSGVVPAAAL